MRMANLTRRTALAGLSAFAALRPDRAIAAWPERNITLLHGLAPGGGVDVTARIVAEGLSRRLGRPVVVESKPGAATTIAAAQIARAAPDGYTLGFVPISHAVAGATYKQLPYHPINDFTFISQATDYPFVVVTHPAHAVKSISDLIYAARTRSVPLMCGTIGLGSMQHLLAAYLAQLAKIEIQTIPFRGGAPAMTELLAGRIDLFIDPPGTLLENIRAGKLRAIAVTSKARFADLPDVPTIAEAGFAGFSVMSWVGLVGPARLPQEIVARLNAEIRAHLTEPEVAQRIRALGSEPVPGSPSDFREIVSSDLQRWNTVVADAGIERI
jgi:tripartite-type tricarboxylate transporter receptor subunit TctC